MQASAMYPRGRAGQGPPRRGQATQQPRTALSEPGTISYNLITTTKEGFILKNNMGIMKVIILTLFIVLFF